MFRPRNLGVAACLLMAPLPLLAGNFDGSRPLVCAAIEAVECESGQDCTQGPPWEVNLPIFMELDFQKKQVTSIDALYDNRVSPMLVVKQLEGVLVALGAEGDHAWSFAISQDTGMMSLTVSGKEHGFIVTAACNPK